MRAIHLSLAFLTILASAEERTEHFDKDPGWDGLNNRSTIEMRPVIQDFGYVTLNQVADNNLAGAQKLPDGASTEPAFRAQLSYTVPAGIDWREVKIIVIDSSGHSNVLFQRVAKAGHTIAAPVTYTKSMIAEVYISDKLVRRIVYESDSPPRTENIPTGAIGGTITPDGHPAYYAKPIPEVTMDSSLSASGTMTVKKGGGNILFGFFNSKTVNEWRTPNTLVFRINGRGETFHAHTEYTSSKWRATAGVIGRYDKEADRMHAVENPCDASYTWSINYDPKGNDGAGTMTCTLNDLTAITEITPELRKDGATFDRFGLLTVVKHTDDPGEFYFHIDKINGETIDLSKDPMWDAVGNKAKFLSDETRPRFNFGYSQTNFAGGEQTGEFGGLFFRGDCRYPEKLAYYGARVEPLTLAKPLRASGKVVFKRGISDSTTLLGFFHSEHSVRVHDSQKTGMPSDFAGFAIEGPSAQGFYAYPCYRVHDGDSSSGYPENMPRIYPDGASHTWKLAIDPGTDGKVVMSFQLDDAPVTTLTIPAQQVSIGATFNRFGFVSPWIDGNGQHVYLDDLTYTVKQ